MERLGWGKKIRLIETVSYKKVQKRVSKKRIGNGQGKNGEFIILASICRILSRTAGEY